MSTETIPLEPELAITYEGLGRPIKGPRALTSDEKRDLLKQLSDEGELEMRGAAEQIGAAIGVSRSNVYYYLRDLRAQVT